MENNTDYNHYRIAVPSIFEEVFSHFYFAENRSDEALTLTLLPSYQTIMVFSFGTPVSFITRQNDQVEIDKCLVIGPIKQAVDYTLPPASEILVANFKDDAFFRFFGNASIGTRLAAEPDHLLDDNCFTLLWTELSRMNTTNEKVNHLLEFCRPYIRARNEIAGQIASFDNEGLSSIKEISEKSNLSERSVQINHKKHFGYSAKEISRYQRFFKAIQLIQDIAIENIKVDWFEIIHQCGYYDQSQLIHDFKHYLNLSPSKYLKFQQSICNPRS
ncbi:helix-turn-helix transcriptional regulator [Chitinophaga tropicalis]|uniref:Helix-turn-helix domain-containing protein n=1 Tax=Chitinophaga tropicalis TaxID=2683588 RepID=A0A7K1U5G1_9BACT|nr:helix-turn-helix domain-containing protein [Chitinophaga tropicalis]MVT09597.1 helix-turn-helix domain-containing protein [Chitinophaga tropicalis]